jgi:hypothetical protein
MKKNKNAMEQYQNYLKQQKEFYRRREKKRTEKDETLF